MSIFVTGGFHKQREASYACIIWCARKLLGKRLASRCRIDVEMSQLFTEQGAAGFCGWEDKNNSPRHFKIELEQRMDADTFLQALCHEMVHVKQFARNELQERYNNPMGHRIMWKGMVVKEDIVDYNDLPWEQEAYALEGLLYEEMLYDGVCVDYNWKFNHGMRKNFMPDLG